MKQVLILLLIFCFLILGCTQPNTIGVPYTTSQFISQSTDINYFDFFDGNYDNKILKVDGNKFEFYSINEDLDGGFANSIYLESQYVDGGNAFSSE